MWLLLTHYVLWSILTSKMTRSKHINKLLRWVKQGPHRQLSPWEASWGYIHTQTCREQWFFSELRNAFWRCPYQWDFISHGRMRDEWGGAALGRSTVSFCWHSHGSQKQVLLACGQGMKNFLMSVPYCILCHLSEAETTVFVTCLYST